MMSVSTAGAITVTSCTGCSVIAEMMPIEGDIEEGLAVCIDPESGKIGKCKENASRTALGISTTHAEQILRLGCETSSVGKNQEVLGGVNNESWKENKACKGWYPIAVTGVHEFVKAECFDKDRAPLRYGDYLTTSATHPGYVRPLSPSEQNSSAILTVLGKAVTTCAKGQETGIIHVKIK